MTNILPFATKEETEFECSPVVCDAPTLEEAQKIAECLERMQGQIRLLRQELMSKHAHLADARAQVENLLSSLVGEHENTASQ